jgi:hypothetical protein
MRGAACETGTALIRRGSGVCAAVAANLSSVSTRSAAAKFSNRHWGYPSGELVGVSTSSVNPAPETRLAIREVKRIGGLLNQRDR